MPDRASFLTQLASGLLIPQLQIIKPEPKIWALGMGLHKCDGCTGLLNKYNSFELDSFLYAHDLNKPKIRHVHPKENAASWHEISDDKDVSLLHWSYKWGWSPGKYVEYMDAVYMGEPHG